MLSNVHGSEPTRARGLAVGPGFPRHGAGGHRGPGDMQMRVYGGIGDAEYLRSPFSSEGDLHMQIQML